MVRLILLLGLLLTCSMASAKIYKWVDAYGEVHYQDHPRGSTEIFSAAETPENKSTQSHFGQKPANSKLRKQTEMLRRQQERERKAKAERESQQALKCINYRFQTDKLAAHIKKKYSHLSQKQPPAEYTQLEKQLNQRKEYLKQFCH